MSRSVLTPVVIATLLAAGFGCTRLAQPPAVAVDSAARFLLNEIAPGLSADGGPAWVELHNCGDAPASLAGWCLADAAQSYRFPADTPAIPPGKGLVVAFAPDGVPLADRQGTEPAVLYAPGQTEFLQGKSNELALYRDARPSTEALVDFASWGRRSATEQSQWAAAARLHVEPLARTEPMPGEMMLMAGDSIGRPNQAWVDEGGHSHSGEYWAIYRAAVTTPGAENPLPPPTPLVPLCDRAAVGGSGFTAIWYGAPPRYTAPFNTHYQVATDPGFAHLAIDVSVRGPYGHRPPLPEGDYFWRARVEGEGFVTPWTQTIAYHEQPPEAEAAPAASLGPPPTMSMPAP